MQKTQMEQWSILSNKLNYMQHSRLNSMDHSLDIRPINKHKSQSNDSHKEFREVDFGKDPQNLQDEYLDVYEGIQSDIVSLNRFDENSDISMTYLGQIEQKGSQNKLKAEEFISHIREWLHHRKTVGWHKMSTTIGHRCKQVLHVKIILYAL